MSRGVFAVQASDCSWLYFDRGLLKPILEAVLKKPQDAHQLPYVLAAFMDAHPLLQHETVMPDQPDKPSLSQVSLVRMHGPRIQSDCPTSWLLCWMTNKCFGTGLLRLVNQTGLH